MRKVDGVLVELWRGLPKWMRCEMRRGCRVGWVYSGMEAVGWSWSGSIVGVGFEEDLLKEGEEGEIIPSEPIYYMEYIRGLVGEDKVFRSELMEGVLRIGVGVEGEWIWGEGLDREEAFLRLVGGVGEWYWVERCPGLGNIRRGELVDPYGSGDDVDFEIEISEVGGEMEVMFKDFFAARLFVGKWERFLIDVMGVGMGERYYHGVMRMLEGDIKIYSAGVRNINVGSVYGGLSGGPQIIYPSLNVGYGQGGGGISTNMGDFGCYDSEEYKALVDMIKDKTYGYKN